MKVIEPSIEILTPLDGEVILKQLELIGRTCYKSEDRITKDSARKFIQRITRSGHESVIEHLGVSVRLICDRGVTHEIVRHRLCSFSQESTRYANYGKKKFGKEITVIRPYYWQDRPDMYAEWEEAMLECQYRYLRLLTFGATPQEARAVLPNSLKSDIVITTNMREWRAILKQRCDKAAHPQMRQVMLPLLAKLHAEIPVLFESLYQKHYDDIRGK